jgi:predicted metal-dependent peptidase
VKLDLQKLSAAKLWIISPPPGPPTEDSPRDLTYLAHALYALIPVANDDVPRMSCDEWWRIYINTTWFGRASIREIGEQLAHLTWHLLLEHAERARDQGVDRSTASAWAKAADVTISHTLSVERLCPDDLPTASDLRMRPGLSAEEYFAFASHLPVRSDSPVGSLEPADGCGSGADGLSRTHEYGPDTDMAAVSRFDATEIRRRVAIDYQEHASQRGHEPGDALRWVRNTLEPRISWEPLLTSAIRRALGWAAGRGDFTYTRPSRRASTTPGIVLPGQRRPLPRLSILVDTSASVDDQLLSRALGEVDGAISALGVPGSSITVYSVDAAVHTVAKVRRAQDVKLIGAGGTDLRIGLRAIERERPRPDVVIVFTDGDTPWPASPPPGAVVIAALLGRNRQLLPPTPNWITRVECVLDV